MTKVNLGCGNNILDGWINCDINTTINNKIKYLDLSKKFYFDDNSIDVFLCEHSIEHLDYIGQKNLLSEIYRCLKPNGTCRLICPTIDFLFNLYKEPEKYKQYIKWWNNRFIEEKFEGYYYNGVSQKEKDENPIFIINLFFKKFGHKLIHSKKSLLDIIKEFNFNVLETNLYEPNNQIFLNCEGHSKSIGKYNNEVESIAFELTKY